MTARKVGAPLLLICCAFGLISCERQDWRMEAIALAEEEMRADVHDPAAQFSHVQVTGDSATGQSCGFVRMKGGPTTLSKVGRFIVYIDGNGGSGPYVEAGMGSHFLSQEDFDFAWQNDCLNEGYKS
jgi:hypothetical protein